MKDTKEIVLVFALSWFPYCVVAYMLSHFDSSSVSFWGVLAVLLGLRLVFSLMEFSGSVLRWQLYGKKKTVRAYLDALSTNGMPRFLYARDLDTYLYEVIDDFQVPPNVRAAAREIRIVFGMQTSQGFWAGLRFNKAASIALEMFCRQDGTSKILAASI